MESAYHDRKTNVCVCVRVIHSVWLVVLSFYHQLISHPDYSLFTASMLGSHLLVAVSRLKLVMGPAGLISCITQGTETVQPFHQPLHYYQLTWMKCELEVKSCHVENKNRITGHHHAGRVVVFEAMTSIVSFKRLCCFFLLVWSLKRESHWPWPLCPLTRYLHSGHSRGIPGCSRDNRNPITVIR